MQSITPEQLDRIGVFTYTDRLRALVILNQFYWDNFAKTYRNSADLITLNYEQAQQLLERLELDWNKEEFSNRNV
ncbi:hypothetical protein [Candidatus Cyanaurora vandensis]|uniref:hypothetical protein n=1 Tax=Candidatus Cyanaurora vandensis TaxID=2714958 RepID=UPI00257F96B2|nr:hypothetical protein [Candidatus Cyanaurora vandensis]